MNFLLQKRSWRSNGASFQKVLMLFMMLTFSLASAEGIAVTGCIVDSTSHAPLQNVTVVLTNIRTANVFNTATDGQGIFQFYDMAQASYLLKISRIGYRELEKTIKLQKPQEQLGTLLLSQRPVALATVDVVAQLPPVEQHLDTVQYNAGAFKTNPDATVEDLVKKLPGVTVEDKTVKAHGEEIKQVFVDGKQFFGTDPMIALRNLPADMVDKIQVYDKLSDQAELTKFDDGQSIKTMNVITKEDRRHGEFGKIYGGYGSERYSVGAVMNVFHSDERYTVIASSNNVNRQDFAAQDMLGAMSGSGGAGGGPGSGNTSIGQQSGDNTVHTFGLNYGNQFAKNIFATGNYFCNIIKNENEETVNRQYGVGTDVNQLYNETSNTNNNNYNHRLQMRMEYNIDSLNAIIVDPRFSIQMNDASNVASTTMSAADGSPMNKAQTASSTNSKGYTLETSSFYRHLFNTEGRTLIAGLRFNSNQAQSDGITQSVTDYYTNGIMLVDSVNQKTVSRSPGHTIGGNLAYTEPLGEHHLFQLSYNVAATENESNKKVYGHNSIDQRYDILNDSLSNVLSSNYMMQQVAIGYRGKIKSMNVIADVALQHASLRGEYTFPTVFSLSREYSNVLPMMMLMYRPSSSISFRLMYRTSTASPSISQLQSVTDNSKSTMLTVGNPSLSQSYTHEVLLHYSFTNMMDGSSSNLMVNVRRTDSYIATATYLFSTDTTLSDGTVLNRGTQLSKPVNVDGYYQVNAMYSYGIPIDWIKCNLNLNTGLTYSRMPAVTNDVVNYSHAYGWSDGIVVSSNISQGIDFTLMYNCTFTSAKNSTQPSLNNHYFQHHADARTCVNIWNGIIVRNDVSQQLYDAEGISQDRNYLLWNLSIAKKLLKNQSLEIALTAYDLLHQNQSIAHTVTSAYIEDTQSKMLMDYLMLTVTYTMRTGTL
jgi:hypothetical protein